MSAVFQRGIFITKRNQTIRIQRIFALQAFKRIQNKRTKNENKMYERNQNIQN